jgi:predicted Zn-dependent protease
MTELQLPPAMAALRPELGNLVASIEQHAPYGSILLSAREGLQISIDHREERVTERPRTAGAVLSAFDGVTLHEEAVSGFDRSALARAARLLTTDRSFAARSVDPGPVRRGDFSTSLNPLSLTEKLAYCRDVQHRLRGLDPRIVNAQVTYFDDESSAVFCSRTADLAQRVQRLHLSLLVVVSGPDGIRYEYTAKSSAGDWEALLFGEADLQAAVDNALALLSAERIEPGEYTIVTTPSVAGVIAHESFGHGVETDMFLKERARAAHFIDKMVGSPLVNIYDDPSLAGAYGSYFFDDEGQLAAPTAIVEQGVFKRGITDLYSATALNIPRSANGRRQDFSRKAYARMSNTFFGSGDTPLPDLFAQVENGIYLEKVSSGMEDPQGWGIQVTCHYGREIKHGQVTKRMFAPIAITGYVPDVLQTVSAVGNDFALDAGGCGKGHKELVLVTSGGPHLLMKARLG